MKKFTVVLTIVLYLAGGMAYARSLGEHAMEEQKRREGVSADRVTTFYYNPPPVMPVKENSKEASADDEYASDETENPRDADAEELEASDSSPEEAGRYEITDLRGNNEAYWRKTMSDARNLVKQLEEEASALTLRRNALQLQLSTANGSRRGLIRDDIDKIVIEQDTNRKNLEEARGELQSRHNEARSSGALPGWVE